MGDVSHSAALIKASEYRDKTSEANEGGTHGVSGFPIRRSQYYSVVRKLLLSDGFSVEF